MKQKLILIVAGIVIFGAGFFLGMEFKAYQIRSAIQQAFSGITTSSSPVSESTAMDEAKKDNMTVIGKSIGDEITLATMNIKVNSAEEKQTISASYGSPKMAKEGTKFVVINMDVTNITNSKFTFSPDLLLVDNKAREYSTYSDSIGGIDNYLNYRDLSPSVKESGFMVYEVPTDSTSYDLVTAKAGTKELYKINLK